MFVMDKKKSGIDLFTQEAIDNGEFDDKYSKESIDRVRDDLMSMKIKLEQDKDDLFILYAL